MSAMAALPPAVYGSGKRLTDMLADAISPFSPTFCIGSENRQPVALGDSLQFVVQPDGQGHKARNVSSEVFARRASLQLNVPAKARGQAQVAMRCWMA